MVGSGISVFVIDGMVPTGNAFLDNLPVPVRSRIAESLDRLDLAVRDSIYVRGHQVSHVYFPIDGVISNVCTMVDGSQVEVGIIGREGLTGIPVAFLGAPAGTDLYTQVAGAAWRLPLNVVVNVFAESQSPQNPFLSYAEAQIGAIAQYAACNRLHSLEERFARWLVMVHDRVIGDELRITHEFLGLMLGVRRAGVTVAANAFQNSGLIQYSKGRIEISDRPRLQAVACECYQSVEDRFEILMGYSAQKYRGRA